MPKNSVLHVLDRPMQASGVATHVRDLIKLQQQHGYDAQAMVLTDSLAIPAVDFASSTFVKTFDVLQGWSRRATLREQLAHLKPSLIHLHAGFTTISPVLVRTFAEFAPTVGTLHDVRPFCFHADRIQKPESSACTRQCGWGCFSSGCYSANSPVDLLKRFRTIATGLTALSAWRELPQVIVPSRYMKELALQHGFSPKTLALIANFTETEVAEADRTPKKSEPLIIYMGRLTIEKGVLVLFDALKQLQNLSWKALFIGDGQLLETLATGIAEYGLQDRISILTQSDRRQRSLIIADADMLVMPSLIPESFGLSGIEALAQAVPVVSFALGGITEWLYDQQTGLIAQLPQSDELAKQIRRLLEEPDFARQLGHNGRVLVEREFSPATAMQKLVIIYDKQLKSPCAQN